MPWQDAVFTMGSTVFFLSLLPTLLDARAYVPRRTSILTASVLTVYCFVFITMGMPFSSATGFMTASSWWGIALLRGTPRD